MIPQQQHLFEVESEAIGVVPVARSSVATPASPASSPLQAAPEASPAPRSRELWVAVQADALPGSTPDGAGHMPGELVRRAPIPAIANAIFDACGVRLTTMPFTPESVLRGLDALRAGEPVA